jgi:hypothetical protein
MGVGLVHLETLSDNAGKKRAKDKACPHSFSFMGISMAEIARNMGVTTPVIA